MNLGWKLAAVVQVDAEVTDRAALAFTATIIAATTLTLRTAPTHYEAPIGPAQAISGVPAAVGLGPLSAGERALRAKLRKSAESGPERLVPLAR